MTTRPKLLAAVLLASAVLLGAFIVPPRPVLAAANSSMVQLPADSTATLEALTSAVAAQLRCPVCQGLSIEASPTELALEMRAVVRDQLAAGRTPDEVRAYFVSKYGEWILLQPKPEGFNLAVYALPVLVLLLGGGTVLLAVRRWTRQGGESLVSDGEAQAEMDHV